MFSHLIHSLKNKVALGDLGFSFTPPPCHIVTKRIKISRELILALSLRLERMRLLEMEAVRKQGLINQFINSTFIDNLFKANPLIPILYTIIQSCDFTIYVLMYVHCTSCTVYNIRTFLSCGRGKRHLQSLVAEKN